MIHFNSTILRCDWPDVKKGVPLRCCRCGGFTGWVWFTWSAASDLCCGILIQKGMDQTNFHPYGAKVGFTVYISNFPTYKRRRLGCFSCLPNRERFYLSKSPNGQKDLKGVSGKIESWGSSECWAYNPDVEQLLSSNEDVRDLDVFVFCFGFFHGFLIDLFGLINFLCYFHRFSSIFWTSFSSPDDLRCGFAVSKMQALPWSTWSTFWGDWPAKRFMFFTKANLGMVWVRSGWVLILNDWGWENLMA